MRIAALGRTGILLNSIRLLHNAGHKIVLIGTCKEAPHYDVKGRDFEVLADELGADFFNDKFINSPGIIKLLQNVKADIAVSVNWLTIVGSDAINAFPLGILNSHAGDLPRYRGNACPNWAIINGEKEVVLSIHLIEGNKLDCGRIISQDRYPITNETYIGHIYEWAEKSTPKLFNKALELLEKDPNYTLKYADSNSPESLRCYPRIPEDSRIDWSKSAIKIHRLIRASSEPFSGAYCFVDGKERVTIWKAELFDDGERYCAVPGQISSVTDKYFTVITGKGKIKITSWDSQIKIKSVRQRLT